MKAGHDQAPCTMPLLLSPQKGHLPLPSPKNLERLLAELIARDWAESTRALVLGASTLMAALWVSLSKVVRSLCALRLDARKMM